MCIAMSLKYLYGTSGLEDIFVYIYMMKCSYFKCQVNNFQLLYIRNLYDLLFKLLLITKAMLKPMYIFRMSPKSTRKPRLFTCKIYSAQCNVCVDIHPKYSDVDCRVGRIQTFRLCFDSNLGAFVEGVVYLSCSFIMTAAMPFSR